MIRFILKGILRDQQRSWLPILIVAIGVWLTVLLSTWITGAMGDMVRMNANFSTGHVKVMSRAYAAHESQVPNDLALLGVDSLQEALTAQFPEMTWVKRIRFGGLIDVPDEQGETRAQGPVSGWALNLFEERGGESERLSIPSSLVTGSIPARAKEALISHDLAQKLQLKLGDTITFFGSTMYGSMCFQNFNISGTVSFGATAMDRGGFIIDISDAQAMLNMEDAAGELLGYFGKDYDDPKATKISNQFNQQYASSDDEFAPTMIRLQKQPMLEGYLELVDSYTIGFILLFAGAMSIVLWNMGMIAGLRRYKEYGIRLALGEGKWHIYRLLLLEALMIGVIGSILGTAFGLLISWPIQAYGIDFGSGMQAASMMFPTVFHTKITPLAMFIGFLPGVLSMLLGNALSGLAVFKRNTAQLFKELEV